MKKHNIINLSRKYVKTLFEQRLPKCAHYHSLKHTRAVVSGCRKIGRISGLKSGDIEILMVAGWFHDTGYTLKNKQNEVEGASIARQFLSEHGYPVPKVRTVVKCIMATTYPQHPRELLEKVICDADMASLGRKTFLRENELLRKETMKCENRKISVSEWLRRSEIFLASHRFHTKYGKTVLEEGRRDNLGILATLRSGNKSAGRSVPVKSKGKTKRLSKEGNL